MQKKINAQKLKIAAGLIFNCHPPNSFSHSRRSHRRFSEQRNLAKIFYFVHRSDDAYGLSGCAASSEFLPSA
jgi:hypothetical protein